MNTSNIFFLKRCVYYILFQKRGIEGDVKGEVGAGESPESSGASPGGQCG